MIHEVVKLSVINNYFPFLSVDHLTYYNKWGNPNSTYRISRYALKLNKLHLNIVTKALFLFKRVFKL